VKDSGIREAVIGDAPSIARLVTELGYRTTPDAMRERLGRLLDNQGYATYVAESGGEVVGVSGGTLDLYYEKDGVYARLTVLAVSPSARGSGVGRQLVDMIERWAASRGARELFVNSGFHRPDAHAFYERCGFTRTGFRFVRPVSADTGRGTGGTPAR
jgi:GNAT superfamily N-acetyltransferase